MKRLKRFSSVVVMVIILFGLYTCNDNQVQSKWNRRAIEIEDYMLIGVQIFCTTGKRESALESLMIPRTFTCVLSLPTRN